MYSYLKYKEGCFLFDISVIYDAGVVGLRMIMPLLAIVIVYQCYAAPPPPSRKAARFAL